MKQMHPSPAQLVAAPITSRVQRVVRFLIRDPRHYQMAMLSGFLLYGMAHFDFGMSRPMIAVTLISVLVFQTLFNVAFRLRSEWQPLAISRAKGPRALGIHLFYLFDVRSPLISGLSLCLLLRTAHWWMAVLVAGVAIGSKFIIRVKGRHIFNPTNFGIAAVLLLGSGDLFPSLLPERLIWVSSGQWGSGPVLAFLFFCLGFLVVFRAARMDISIALLAWYALFTYGLAFYLGDPMAIPNRRMLNGALFLFAFFMISDPKTSPDSRWGRILFAGLVALIACEFQYNLSYTLVAAFGVEPGWWWLFPANGIFYALLFCSACLPLFNLAFKGRSYEWPGANARPATV